MMMIGKFSKFTNYDAIEEAMNATLPEEVDILATDDKNLEERVKFDWGDDSIILSFEPKERIILPNSETIVSYKVVITNPYYKPNYVMIKKESNDVSIKSLEQGVIVSKDIFPYIRYDDIKASDDSSKLKWAPCFVNYQDIVYKYNYKDLNALASVPLIFDENMQSYPKDPFVLSLKLNGRDTDSNGNPYPAEQGIRHQANKHVLNIGVTTCSDSYIVKGLHREVENMNNEIIEGRLDIECTKFVNEIEYKSLDESYTVKESLDLNFAIRYPNQFYGLILPIEMVKYIDISSLEKRDKDAIFSCIISRRLSNEEI